jgi:hypothetical protein
MWKPTPIAVEVLAATRPPATHGDDDGMVGKGLVTVRVTVPLFVWTEVLTHRRFARNAASARAMRDPTTLGYYHPTTFYYGASGMKRGKEVTAPHLVSALHLKWGAAHRQIQAIWADMVVLGEEVRLAKEQGNRLLPTTRMVRGIITGTEAAWQAFLALRDHPTADTAMIHLAKQLRHAFHTAPWRVDMVHKPYAQYASVALAVASLARVSYARDAARIAATDVSDLTALYAKLRENKHYSPFEHVAIWTESVLNPFACRCDDVVGTFPDPVRWYTQPFYGWLPYRALIDGTYPNDVLEQQIIQSYTEVRHGDNYDHLSTDA